MDILTRLRGLGRNEIEAEAADEIERLRLDGAKLRTVMVAAAEEIQAHWDAHCDAEGYGPANLMHRLEEGIPSQYGYAAGDFERLRLDAARYRWLRNSGRICVGVSGPVGLALFTMDEADRVALDAALDAAMKA